MTGRPQAATALGVADTLTHDAVEHWLRETAEAINAGIVDLLASLGRTMGTGGGGHRRA